MPSVNSINLALNVYFIIRLDAWPLVLFFFNFWPVLYIITLQSCTLLTRNNNICMQNARFPIRPSHTHRLLIILRCLFIFWHIFRAFSLCEVSQSSGCKNSLGSTARVACYTRASSGRPTALAFNAICSIAVTWKKNPAMEKFELSATIIFWFVRVPPTLVMYRKKYKIFLNIP